MFKGAIKEAATLLSGSVVAQVITLVAYFVLLHIYTPADYGLFTIFYSYIEVLIILSTCKYEMAVVAADTEADAAAVSRFALRLNTFVSLLLLTVLFVLNLLGWMPGKFERLGWLALLIAPMVFFCGNNRVYSSLYNRFHRYKAIATSEVVGSGSGAVIKTMLGLLGIHSSGLPLGAVLGQAMANINYRLGMKGLGLPTVTAEERRAAASRYRNFPKYVAPKDFISSLSSNLPFIWLALYFDNTYVGFLGIAVTFILQPCNLISGAFERVLYARTAEAVRDKRSIAGGLLRFILGIEGITIVVSILLWFFAEPLFAFCFGGRWQGCGVYVRALLPWVVMAMGYLPLMFIPNIFGTQRTEFCIYIVQLALRVGAIVIGIMMSDFLLAVRLFAGVSAFIALILTGWYIMQIVRYERSVQ